MAERPSRALWMGRIVPEGCAAPCHCLNRANVLQFKASTNRELPSWIELYSDAFPAAAAPLRSGGAEQSAPHGVFALHACDTATDEAAAYAVHARAHALVVAPCCQAELARSWRALAAPEQSTMRGGGGVRATRAAEEAKVLRAASPACSTGAGETRDHDDDDGGGGGGGGLRSDRFIARRASEGRWQVL